MFAVVLMALGGCTTEKKVGKWLDKHPDKFIRGDTTYVEKIVEQKVEITVPADTVGGNVGIEKLLEGGKVTIKNDTSDVSVTLEVVEEKTGEKVIQVTGVKKVQVIRKTVYDTVRTAIAIEYHPDVARYELQTDSLKSQIVKKDKKITKLSKKAKRRGRWNWIFILLVIAIGLFGLNHFTGFLKNLFSRKE